MFGTIENKEITISDLPEQICGYAVMQEEQASGIGRQASGEVKALRR